MPPPAAMAAGCFASRSRGRPERWTPRLAPPYVVLQYRTAAGVGGSTGGRHPWGRARAGRRRGDRPVPRVVRALRLSRTRLRPRAGDHGALHRAGLPVGHHGDSGSGCFVRRGAVHRGAGTRARTDRRPPRDGPNPEARRTPPAHRAPRFTPAPAAVSFLRRLHAALV